MADYSEEVATARELIEDSGELVEWTQGGETYNDFVTFIPPGGSVTWLSAMTGTALPAGLTVGLVPGDAPFVPELNAIIKRPDGSVYTVLPGTDKLAPNSLQPILYTVRLGQ